MSEPTKPPPRCPLHGTPMFPAGIDPTHEKFTCHKLCSIEIHRPLNLPPKPKP